MSENPNIKFNINISGSSIGNKAVQEKIEKLIVRYQIKPALLVFEITETATVSNLYEAKQFISRIKKLGSHVALDDFGSGMSSFGLLKVLDVDYIKLDGSFVKYIHNDPEHYAMVEAINSVSQVMGKQTIAEFVENKEIASLLKQIGIDYGQGYYYHRPAPLTMKSLNRVEGVNIVNFTMRV